MPALKIRASLTALAIPNQLPSLPKIYRKLNAAVADENITVTDLAGIFAQDMVLSAKLPHLENSACFGLHRHVSNLGDAINMSGKKSSIAWYFP